LKNFGENFSISENNRISAEFAKVERYSTRFVAIP
jgi:hypothetical protein